MCFMRSIWGLLFTGISGQAGLAEIELSGAARVERFMDERDYRMKKASGIVLLDGALCSGTGTTGPCDRSCFFFWREEWLEKLDGQAGLDCFAREPIDIVLTDLNMPVVSGWDIAERVKKIRPSVPVVLLSLMVGGFRPLTSVYWNH